MSSLWLFLAAAFLLFWLIIMPGLEERRREERRRRQDEWKLVNDILAAAAERHPRIVFAARHVPDETLAPLLAAVGYGPPQPLKDLPYGDLSELLNIRFALLQPPATT